jgi:hypothetical protein
MRSWHDYHLTGYSVDGPGARIVFNVSWPYDTSTDIRTAKVVFSGVAGYCFVDDLGSNILYSISESPLDTFLAEHARQFEQRQKWGWPLFWKGTVDATFKFLNEAKALCFEVSSSYGLEGWVLATRVDVDAPQP